MELKHWLKGLVAAVISGAATVVTNISAGQILGQQLSWKFIGTSAGIAGLIAAANYLKQSPIPDSTFTQTVTVTKEVTVNNPENSDESKGK